MGKQLDRNQSTLQFDRYYRGCIWGLFPLPFHSFKKLMPHRRHHDETSPKYGVIPQYSEADDTEVLEARDADCVSPIKALFKGRTSRKNRNKVKVTQRPKLERTYSIHHLEPSSCGLDDLTADNKQSVVLQKTANTSDDIMYVSTSLSHLKTIPSYRVSGPDKLDSAQLAGKSGSGHFSHQDILDHGIGDDCQSSSESSGERCQFEDFFDAFKIDKKLFMENKKKADADSSGGTHSLLKSHRKLKLIRSGSFPKADQSSSSFYRSGSFRSSKLEHKLTEAWPSFSSFSSSLSSSSFSSCSSSSTKSEDVLAPRNSTVYETPEEDLVTSVNNKEVSHEDTSQAAGDRGEDSDYTSNVKSYKLKRIARATSLSESDVNKYTQNRLSRASSLNESLEKYTQLFETSIRRDAKFNVSRSLRLFREDDVGLNLPSTESFRRVHSLGDHHQLDRSRSIEYSNKPDKATTLESYCHDQSESEVSDYDSGTTDPTALETSTGFTEASSNILKTESASTTLISYEELETSVEEHNIISQLIIPGNYVNHQPQQEIEFSRSDLDEVAHQEPCSVSEYAEGNDKWCAAQPFEGLEHRFIDTFSLEPMIVDELPIRSEVDSHSDTRQNAKDTKSLTRDSYGVLQGKDLDTENNNDFMSVQNALAQLGAIGTTHSLSKTTTFKNCACDNLLLDLVTEVLLDVYEGCDAYWRSSLCKNCHFHRLPPTEHHVSKMVWSKVKKLQCFSQKTDITMDSVVSFDLADNDGWLNLQADAESLGLAMEELVFDELIEELIYE